MLKFLLSILISISLIQPAIAANYAQVFDALLTSQRASGVTLSGGKAYFYVPGTETLKTIYSSRTKTIAANPYTLSADGTAQIYGDGLYDVKITNAAGVQKYLWEDVSLKDASGEFHTLSDYASLAAAVAAIGATPATLLVPSDTTVSADTIIPITMSLQPINGAIITIASGKTLTINGPFIAGLVKCFDVAGTLKFGPNSIAQIEIHWTGADTTLADNAAGIQLALDAAAADLNAMHPVHAAAGKYTTSTFYVPEGIRFFGDGAIETTAKSGTTFIQKAGTNTDTLRVIPHDDGGGFLYWYGTIENMSFLGEAAGSAGSGISFKNSADTGVYPQDTTVIRNVSIRRYPSHGINFPVGALPLTCSDVKLLFNGGHGIYFKGSANAVQAVHFLNVSGDGNLGGDSTGGALIMVENVDIGGHLIFTNLKSEQRTNSDRGGTTGNTHVLIFKNSSPNVVVNGITHASSTGVKPGDIININTTSVPTINWNGVVARLLPGDTGSDPYLINDQINTKTVPYTVSAGIYGSAPVTGVFSVASANVFDTFGTTTSYMSRSAENPARQVSGATPGYSLYETDADADEKMWLWVSSSGNLSFRTVADAGTAGDIAFQVTRNGTTVTGYSFIASAMPAFANDAAATAAIGSNRVYKYNGVAGVSILAITP